MTAAPVMSITDELIAELEAAANAAIAARVAYACTHATELDMHRARMTFQDIATDAVVCALLAERAELKKSGWISVAERLPEPATDVLVFGLDHAMRRFTVAGMFHAGKARELFWASQETEESTRFDVTHWMPLPEPPQ